MQYLIPLYCVLTAITALLAALHWKLWYFFYVVVSSVLALAVGSEVRTLPQCDGIVKKMVRTLMAVAMLIAAFWFSPHFSINLYFRYAPGMIWVILGVVLGFFAHESVRERRKRPRK